MSESCFLKRTKFGLALIIGVICFFLANSQSYVLAQPAKFLPISIQTNDSLPNGYSLAFSVDHKSLIDSNLSELTGDDIRIFYDSSGLFIGDEKEVDAVLDESSKWNKTDTKIWFRLQEELTASFLDSTHYRLYYGGIYETAPLRDKRNVYYFFDDFSDGLLNDWEVDSNASFWQEADGVLISESGGAQIKKNTIQISNYFTQVEIKKINSNQYVGIFGRLVNFNRFYLFSRDRNAHDWRLNRNYDEQWNTLAVNEDQNTPENGDIISLKITSDNIIGYLNGQKVAETNDSAINDGTVGLFSNGENSYTEFDNFLIRKSVPNEPFVNLVWNSTTPTVTISPSIGITGTWTPTPTYIVDDSLSSTPTPTPTLIPDSVDDSIRILSAETYDSDFNGKIDQIILRFNVDLNGATVTNSDFSVVSYALSNSKAKEENGLVTLYLTEANYFDTGNKPEVVVRNQGVKDLSNNWNSEIKVVAQDKAAPYFILDNPIDGNYYFNNGINFAGISSDYSGAEDSVAVLIKIFFKKQEANQWYELDTLSNDSFLEPYEWSLHKDWLEENGIYDFKIESYDLDGNISEKNLTSIAIDDIKPLNPTIYSTSHTINEWSNNNIIKFIINAQNDLSKIRNYYFGFGNFSNDTGVSFNKLDTNVANFDSDKLKDGIYYLFFKTENRSGSSSEVLTFGPFKIDTQKPLLTLNYVKNLSQIPEINFQIFPTDELSGVKSVEANYQDPQGNNKTLNSKNITPYTFSFITDGLNLFGKYLFSFKTIDNAGNFETLSTYIGIESTIFIPQITENPQSSNDENDSDSLTTTPGVVASDVNSPHGSLETDLREINPTVLGTSIESTSEGESNNIKQPENYQKISGISESEKLPENNKDEKIGIAIVLISLLAGLILFRKFFTSLDF
ncbi:hypothetical protein HY345_02370 [Candidatus Microgenomates bacterium]|nr:hypothetical protein [Candidatus Microgenomates bacterium]